MQADDPLLSRLIEDGYDLDLKNPVIDTEATIRKLKRMKVEMSRIRLPSGLLARRRKLAEICERMGVSPEWCD